MLSVQDSNQLKGLTILVVMLLHVLPHLQGVLPFWLLGSLDQLGRFSVPMFLILSGYGIAKKYSVPSLRQVYSQILKLLPAYVMWSLLLSWWVRPGGVWEEQLVWWPYVIKLLTGKFDYHLYFVPVLISCYVLAPWLLSWLSKWPKQVLGMLMASTAIVLLLIQVLSFSGEVSWLRYDQYVYTLPLVWLGYFVVGAWLAKAGIPKVPLALVFFASSVLLIEGFLAYFLVADTNLAFRFTRVSVMVYATVINLWLMGVATTNTFPKVFGRLGKQSLQIYLGHTLAIRVALSLGLGTISWTTAFLVVISGALCWGISSWMTGWVAHILRHQH